MVILGQFCFTDVTCHELDDVDFRQNITLVNDKR